MTTRKHVFSVVKYIVFLPLSNFEYPSSYLHRDSHNDAFTYSLNPIIPPIYRSIEKVICCLFK